MKKVYVLDSYHTHSIQALIQKLGYELCLDLKHANVALLSGKMILYGELNLPTNCRVVAMSTMSEFLNKIEHQVDATLDKSVLFGAFDSDIVSNEIRELMRKAIEG